MKDKKFYIDFSHITRIYPRETSKRVQNFGVLEQFKDNKYTLREINEIIAELMVKTPFIKGSMEIKLTVNSNRGYHHILVFKNYEYEKQNREDSEKIGFLFG